MSTPAFAVFDTALGRCAVAWGRSSGSPHALIGALLPEASEAALRARLARRFPGAREALPPEPVAASIGRIRALLTGHADDLSTVELDLAAVPPFQRRVYALVRSIRPGTTLTYGEVAARLGAPNAARAVGRALGVNPFPIIVPCHRVLGAGGVAGGFSAPGGARTKLRLLEIERAPLGGSPGLFD